MTACFSWILDARLHITLTVSLVVSAVSQSGSPAEPAPESPFNAPTTITFPDGTIWRDGDPIPDGESPMTASASVEER